MDAGVGAQQPFVTDDSLPLKNAKSLAKNSMKRLKNEMMGKIAN